MIQDQNIIKIALIGASGAIGKEIVRHAMKNSQVQLTVIVRNQLDEWKNYQDQLKIINLDNFENINSLEQVLQNQDGFICTLGTRVKTGDLNFTNVDYKYPLEFAKLAKKLEIKYFGLLTSTGSNENSLFLYLRIKGKIEKATQQLGIKNLSIFKPGFLKNRDGDFRWIEYIMNKLNIGKDVESKDMGLVMLDHAIKHIKDNSSGQQILEKNDIFNFLKENQK